MGSTYYLGWPGLESAPVHIIDIKSHQIFNKSKPLPNNLAYVLNTVENRYVELSWIVNRFGVSNQQAALNVLMKLVGDLAMPKFYVGPDNVAYVPLNTLFTFVVCHPTNTSFRICRNSLLTHLGNFLELPCSVCGFVRRDCICESRLYDIERDHYICSVKEIRSTGIQCDDSRPSSPKRPVYTSSAKLQELVDEVARGGTGDSMPNSVPGTPKDSPNVLTPGVPPPFPWGPQHMKNLFSPMYPPQLAPAPPPKPKTREIGIQTRAVYDFSNRKKRLSKKEREDEAIIEAQIAASEKAKTIAEENTEDGEKEKETEEDKSEKPEETDSPSTPQIPSTSEQPTGPVLNTLTTVTPDPVRISLWKLIDSDDDSSEDEKEEKDAKAAIESESKDQEKEPVDKEKDSEDVEMKEDEDKERDVGEKEKESVDNMKDQEGSPELMQTIASTRESTPSQQHEPQAIQMDKTFNKGASPGDKDSTQLDTEKAINEGTAEPMDTDTTQDKPVLNKKTANGSNEVKTTETSTSPITSEAVENPSDMSFQDEFMKSIGKDTQENQTKANDSLMEYQDKLEQVIEEVKSNSGRSTPQIESSTTSEKNASDKQKGSDEVLPSDKEEEQLLLCERTGRVLAEILPPPLQQGELCEITGRVIEEVEEVEEDSETPEEGSKTPEESAKNPEEGIVIPPSPPAPTHLPPIPVEESQPKSKPKLLAKKWAQKFEYTPTQEKIYRCTFSRCGQCFDTKQAAKLHDKAHGAFGQESPTHLVCWECDTYTTTFSKWYDLLRHLRVKHDITIGTSVPNSFPCTFCGVACESEEALSYHINFHYLGKYKCVHCGVLLLSWKQVQMHLAKDCSEAASKKEKKLGCPYCSFVFHIRNMRNIHMLSHIDEGLVCIFCNNNELWENWKQLRKHYQQKHGRKVTSAMNPLKPTKMEIKQNPQCHVCKNEFKVYEDYVYHMRKVHDFVAYVATDCTYCEKTFRTQKAYDWHAKNTHGISADGTLTALRCSQCEYVASSKQMLRAHIAKKHEEKHHECNECGKTFSYYNQLRVHMVQHARKAMYPCKMCDAEFTRHADLRQHVRAEHGKKSASSATATAALEEKECPECSFSCSSNSTLLSHIQRRHPEYNGSALAGNDLEEPDLSDPDYQPALRIAAPKPPTPDPVYPPPKSKPKGRRSYYKGGRRGRGRGRGRGASGRGAAAAASGRGTGGTGVKSLPYLKDRRPGRRSTADMPQIGMNLDEIPELLAGGAMDRDDKKKIKRLLKIKEARIKFQQKACCARSVSYQDHMAMKALDSSTAFSPIANFELNGEPMNKRRRLSSTSSNVPAYAQQSSYQSSYSPYEPSVKLPTQIPESYDLLKYPFIDHCYFKMEGMVLPESPVVAGAAFYDQQQQQQQQGSSGAGETVLQSDDSSDAPSAMMRGVYKPTAWGMGGSMRSYGDDIDVGGELDAVPGTSSDYRTFPSTSFAPPPPPPMPSRRSTTDPPRRKRGRRPGSTSTRKPYGSGKFVPLAPTHEYASGIQEQSNVKVQQSSDTVPLDQFGMDGDVAVQHEVGEADVSFPSMGEEILGGTDDDLSQAPAAEELIEAIPQEHLLKDLITQLESRMQQGSTVPQSPTMSALMRTLIQSPPGSKITGRRLSLGSSGSGSTPQHQSLFDADIVGQSSQVAEAAGSSMDGIEPISDIPPQAEASDTMATTTEANDCLVTVVTSQMTMPSDSIASVLPSTVATTPTNSGASDIDETALNEVYQLLGSKFDNLEDLQKQVGFTATSPSPKSNAAPTVSSPEVIYTTKTTPVNSLPFTPGPGSTSRYRTMAKNVTTVSTAQSSPQVIYQTGGVKTTRRIMPNPPRIVQRQAETNQAPMSRSVVSVQEPVKISTAPRPQNSVVRTVTSTLNTSLVSSSGTSLISPSATATSTAASASGSGRIPVRIQLSGSNTGTSTGPMRIRLPSGTSLGQNVTKISLQQLLKSGANIQSVSQGSSVGPGGTRIIRVPAGSLSGSGLSFVNTSGTNTSPRIVTLPASNAQTMKIAGKTVYTLPQSVSQSGSRIVQVARRGTYTPPTATITKPQEEIDAAVSSITPQDSMETSEDIIASAATAAEVQGFNTEVETVRDELMEALPTDEEIAQNIQAEHLEDGAMESDMQL